MGSFGDNLVRIVNFRKKTLCQQIDLAVHERCPVVIPVLKWFHLTVWGHFHGLTGSVVGHISQPATGKFKSSHGHV